jgi:hypothetical protein
VRSIAMLDQRYKEVSLMSVKAKTTHAVILSAFVAFVVAGCTGNEQETREDLDKQQSFGESEQLERTEKAEEEKAGGGSPSDVVLDIEGTSRTEFSGVCAVGDEEHAIEGRVPERFVYDLQGRKLDCEIQKEDGGAGELKVLLTAPGNHLVQQTSTPGGIINLTYSKNGASSSASSSSSVNQVVSSSSLNSR